MIWHFNGKIFCCVLIEKVYQIKLSIALYFTHEYPKCKTLAGMWEVSFESSQAQVSPFSLSLYYSAKFETYQTHSWCLFWRTAISPQAQILHRIHGLCRNWLAKILVSLFQIISSSNVKIQFTSVFGNWDRLITLSHTQVTTIYIFSLDRQPPDPVSNYTSIHVQAYFRLDNSISEILTIQVPGGAAGLYLLGQLHSMTDQPNFAKQAYESALDLDPTMWSAYERLCQLGILLLEKSLQNQIPASLYIYAQLMFWVLQRVHSRRKVSKR